jgi:hypothetical protein
MSTSQIHLYPTMWRDLVVAVGLGVLIGAAVLLITALFTAKSPPVVGMVARRRPRKSTSSADALARAMLSAAELAVAELSDVELCARWTASWELLRTGTPAQRLVYVQARQHYLDELERRDPAGLRAWLESSASPAGDPRPFISSSRERGDGR